MSPGDFASDFNIAVCPPEFSFWPVSLALSLGEVAILLNHVEDRGVGYAGPCCMNFACRVFFRKCVMLLIVMVLHVCSH